MTVKCIKDFTKRASIFEFNFFKDKKYEVNKINGKKLLSVAFGNIDYDKVKENFVEIIE